MSRRRKNIPAEQWYWNSREMLESPAYRELSLSARRVLDRLHLEYLYHGGKDNGRLPCTYENFVDYGIDRHAIAPAIRECVALGFIEITQAGKPSSGERRFPNYFRLTDRDSPDRPATNEWKQIETVEEARTIAKAARNASSRFRKAQRTRALEGALVQ